MSGAGRSIQTESRVVAARGWEREGVGRDCFVGTRFPFGGDENVLVLNETEVMVVQPCECAIDATELYTLNDKMVKW